MAEEKTKKFKFLEHVSDIYVAAYGKNLEEAFENVALAMFESMTNLSSVEQKIKFEVNVEGEDEESLLYNWLEKLLVKFEVDNFLFSRFKVYEIKQVNNMFKLKAEIVYGGGKSGIIILSLKLQAKPTKLEKVFPRRGKNL